MMTASRARNMKLSTSVLALIWMGAIIFLSESGISLGTWANTQSAQNGTRTEFETEFRTIDLATLPDFDSIPPREIELFYPAQASWDFLTKEGGDHPGSAAILQGIACRSCHQGSLGPSHLGEELVNNPALEPTPIEGKRPSLNLKVKAAYDDTYMYWWFQWESEEPGVFHDVLRYDAASGAWVSFGGFKPDGDPPIYEDRITFQIGQNNASSGYVTSQDGVGYGFQEHGCFITCHDTMEDMPNSDGRSKFLLITEGKSSEEQDALLESGKFLDMWMMRSHRSGPIGYADDFHVFDARNSDEGRSPWSDQRASDLNNPGFDATVFDPAKVSSDQLNGGTYAIRGGDDPLGAIRRLSTIPFLTLPGETFMDEGVPVESISRPLAGSGYIPENNDLLYRRRLRVPTGSRGDILAHETFVRRAEAEMGTWTVILKRRLDTGNSLEDRVLEPGQSYPAGFAVHDDAVHSRFHHVSFPHLVGMGKNIQNVDINAYHVSEIP